jgi:hypothetical protein
MALKLTDLRSWLVVLRDAALMRPHPAAIAATPDDKEIDGYLARLAALLLAGEWVMRRLDRNLLQGLVAFAEPLRRMPELKAHHPGFVVLDGMVAARRVVAESTFLVPPYVINGAVEVATLVGVAILISRSVRPVPPPARAATGAALSALVSGSLFGVVVGWLLLRAAEVSGFLAKARAVQARRPTRNSSPPSKGPWTSCGSSACSAFSACCRSSPRRLSSRAPSGPSARAAASLGRARRRRRCSRTLRSR